jgi:hypothetical protein
MFRVAVTAAVRGGFTVIAAAPMAWSIRAETIPPCMAPFGLVAIGDSVSIIRLTPGADSTQLMPNSTARGSQFTQLTYSARRGQPARSLSRLTVDVKTRQGR